jgi:hypothetical protein
MKGIGHKGKTVYGIANDQFNEKENPIYGEQDFYPA